MWNNEEMLISSFQHHLSFKILARQIGEKKGREGRVERPPPIPLTRLRPRSLAVPAPLPPDPFVSQLETDCQIPPIHSLFVETRTPCLPLERSSGSPPTESRTARASEPLSMDALLYVALSNAPTPLPHPRCDPSHSQRFFFSSPLLPAP